MAHISCNLASVSALLLVHFFPVSSGTFPTIQTSSGPVTGHAAQNRPGVVEYLGIPFAQPPVGNLRFAAPQTYTSSKPFAASNYVCPIAPHDGFHQLISPSAASLRMISDI